MTTVRSNVRRWCAAGLCAWALAASTSAAVVPERLPNGIRLTLPTGILEVHIKTPSVVRVLFSKAKNPRMDTMVVTDASAPPAWTLVSTPAIATLKTSKLQVQVNLANGVVTFLDARGNRILGETPGARSMAPATVQAESTYHVQQQWLANDNESLYGLGQRQEGKLDLKGYDLDLWQRNMVVAMPMVVSSRGYGLLWDNTSFTKFGDIRPFEEIPGIGISAGGGQGEILAPVTGDYQFQTYSNLDIKVWLDGQLRIDHWKQNWATEYDQFKVRLEAGKRYTFKVASSPGATLKVGWKTPAPTPDTALWSEVGEAIDYYFLYGPDLDEVVAGYRTLTGRATMLPQWAFGYWQSKNKYNTQKEVLDTFAEFRRRAIPIDTIVQDWQYWQADSWGSHQFEAARFPDPDAMIKAIHDQHGRYMISVWGKFYPTTDNFKAMQAIGGLYQPTIAKGTKDWLNRNYAFYDVFNAPARKLFWDQVSTSLFAKGVDAWWMDATEPDLVQPSPPTLESLRANIETTASGTASRVMSAYPLMNSQAVYEGQRSSAPNQRVFILTRSGFPGIQRYATVTWSGDITSTWSTLKKQITAGLNFSITGAPYWTTDTGGYTMEGRFTNARTGDALDEWRELNARWFQYSTFTPILRAHGTDRPREPWNIGDETTPVYQNTLKFDKLRYALFPYIYSIAGAVTQNHDTMMRPLVMDFRNDTTARTVTDQFMFGPALLVNPVTEYKARARQVYLPSGTAWYDFWTGTRSAGAQTITADAPYDRLPLYVRAGSIIPVGPDQQYIGEKSAATLTVYVYAGANGQFTLYEDDGVTYGYERRQFSRIPLTWNEATKTLTIGARVGTFPGMVSNRTFNVIVVSPEAPVAYGVTTGAKTVRYAGVAVTVK